MAGSNEGREITMTSDRELAIPEIHDNQGVSSKADLTNEDQR
jgi:hypothetical protein